MAAIALADSLIRALADFRTAFSSDMDMRDDTAESLTCSEIEVFAELMRQLGEPEAADRWIDAHSHGDEEDEEHFRGDSHE